MGNWRYPDSFHTVWQNDRRYLALPQPCSAEILRAKLRRLSAKGANFGIYDPLYPSPSDPGAHICYAPADDNWYMTLGNHGWSGGIYEIEEAVVVRQLLNLWGKSLLVGLDLDRAVFFSRTPHRDATANAEMNRKLFELHGQEPAGDDGDKA